jgi:hypothetical protein
MEGVWKSNTTVFPVLMAIFCIVANEYVMKRKAAASYSE